MGDGGRQAHGETKLIASEEIDGTHVRDSFTAIRAGASRCEMVKSDEAGFLFVPTTVDQTALMQTSDISLCDIVPDTSTDAGRVEIALARLTYDR